MVKPVKQQVHGDRDMNAWRDVACEVRMFVRSRVQRVVWEDVWRVRLLLREQFYG